jgi:GNAT superfamily N-acetyltransferase
VDEIDFEYRAAHLYILKNLILLMEFPENIKVKVLTGRFGSIEEYQEFIELRKEFFQEARRTPRRFFAVKNPMRLQKKMQKNPSKFLFMAVDKKTGKAVGFLQFNMFTGYLGGSYLKSEYRGKGIAKVLLETAHNFGKTTGLGTLKGLPHTQKGAALKKHRREAQKTWESNPLEASQKIQRALGTKITYGKRSTRR